MKRDYIGYLEALAGIKNYSLSEQDLNLLCLKYNLSETEFTDVVQYCEKHGIVVSDGTGKNNSSNTDDNNIYIPEYKGLNTDDSCLLYKNESLKDDNYYKTVQPLNQFIIDNYDYSDADEHVIEIINELSSSFSQLTYDPDKPKLHHAKNGPIKPFLSHNDNSELTIEEQDLKRIIKYRGETFHDMLFRIIDENGYSDVEVYNRAFIDRKYFSKIRSGSIPQRRTVMALCLALHLDIESADELMNTAGYGFSNADITDLIIVYCLMNKIYDLVDVNAYLEIFKEKALRE